MLNVSSALFWLCLLIFISDFSHSTFEFTNIKCNSLDTSFATFEYCLLKSVNRTYKYGSLKVKLLKVPVDKVKLNLALYKRLNGYKPFLYNVTFDVCKFIQNRNSNRVAAFIFNLFQPYSNINHSCPCNHDVVVDKVPTSHMNEQLTKILPFPPGDYGFYSIWFGNGKPRATVNVYGTLS
ncbi:uncharacterized protein [Drosophila kikkawai]|uniref:MD-2-related lipid-recognition domain-containing protein n=1 Tax=Drosophila kikkawai TaxID=30033 RepID=A0ABM4GB48_DROKI